MSRLVCVPLESTIWNIRAVVSLCLAGQVQMEIMATFDESLVPMDERAAEFAPVLSAVIDPLSKACAISATALKAADMAVYLINCLSVVQVCTPPPLFASQAH
jgi:hypothetical protein